MRLPHTFLGDIMKNKPELTLKYGKTLSDDELEYVENAFSKAAFEARKLISN